MTEYFAAASDDVAALALLEREGPSARAEGSGEPLFDTVPMPSIDPFVMLGTLHEILSGRPYRECTAAPRHGQVVGGADEGPWVVTLSDGLVHSLAEASAARLVEVAARWARTPELRTLGPQHQPLRLGGAVASLASLARRAIEVRHTLYCWTRLAD